MNSGLASRRTAPRDAVYGTILPVVLLLGLGVSAPRAAAQVVDQTLWGTNGSVYSMARSGNLLYIGGVFSTVGPCTGGGVPLDARTGAPRRPFARVAGRVSAAVSDGSGGWFIGGHFSGVEGLPRANLAHVLADGSVADWAPSVAGESKYNRTPEPEKRAPGVNALVLVGNTLYVGGLFTSVCGRPRGNLAAVDAGTGALLPWDPQADDEVLCLAAKGGLAYAGGFFANVGGAARSNIAALDLESGVATGWDPHAANQWWYGGNRVRTIVPHGNSILVGGDFDFIGGQPRNSVAILDAATGRATSWDARLEPQRRYIAHGDWIWPFVSAIAVHGRDVFIGGSFDAAGGRARPTLAALDIGSAEATDFDAAMGWSSVYTLAMQGSTLYVGGYLYTIGGEIRPNIAALDCRTGHATSWNPRADGVVEVLATDGATVFAGGHFGSIYDWQPRNCAACLDLTTGAVTPWDPQLGGYALYSLGLIGDTVYMVGAFYSAGGQTRGNIAAVDAATGAARPWDPGYFRGATPANPMLVTTDSAVFVAGAFDTLGGQPRRSFAALDPVTGAATAWDAHADGTVGFAILPYRDEVFVGGNFMHVGGAERRMLAELDAATGTARHWNPGPGGFFITAFAAQGNTLYVGGTFWSMTGQPRNDLAAVDITTGWTLPWNPAPDGDYGYNNIHVNALALGGGHVWAGGNFATIQGQPRAFLAALDPTTGAPTEWQCGATGAVYGLATSGDTVYAGGGFRAMGGFPRGGLAAVIPVSVAGPGRAGASPLANAAPSAVLSLSVPSPVRSSAALRFTLPDAAPVSLAVYDLQGRRLASLLDREPLAAGGHEVTLSASGWRAGVYFCRLQAGGRSITRKLVVAH